MQLISSCSKGRCRPRDGPDDPGRGDLATDVGDVPFSGGWTFQTEIDKGSFVPAGWPTAMSFADDRSFEAVVTNQGCYFQECEAPDPRTSTISGTFGYDPAVREAAESGRQRVWIARSRAALWSRSTRQEVLITERLSPFAFKTARKCKRTDASLAPVDS